jgi:hypothetical protein
MCPSTANNVGNTISLESAGHEGKVLIVFSRIPCAHVQLKGRRCERVPCLL